MSIKSAHEKKRRGCSKGSSYECKQRLQQAIVNRLVETLSSKGWIVKKSRGQLATPDNEPASHTASAQSDFNEGEPACK